MKMVISIIMQHSSTSNVENDAAAEEVAVACSCLGAVLHFLHIVNDIMSDAWCSTHISIDDVAAAGDDTAASTILIIWQNSWA
eukprot:13071801-Ditylum_brightwellii.AAC.1